MPRWNGGVIGAANNPTLSSAKGIWSLSEATKAIRAGLWPPSNAGADPYFENVTLLLPGDGTNGAQNNTFLDSSTNGFTITRNGNTTQGTFTPFSKPDGRWANYFDGTGDYLSLSSNAAFTVGTGNLTIEAWIYCTSLSQAYQGIMSGRANSSPSFPGLGLTIDNNQLLFTIDSIGNGLKDSATVPLNQWVHVVGVRSGTNAALFVNGSRKASATNSENGTSSDMVLGRYYPSVDNYYFSGYISGARLVKGTAVYDPTQSTLTVPTAPLAAITNTSLLTCQSNRFIDNSTNAFAITRNGDVSVQTFSPFPTLTAYSAGTNGGSGYFDGTGDELSTASNSALTFGTGAYTVEFWVYSNVSMTSYTANEGPVFIYCDATNGWGMWSQNAASNYLKVATRSSGSAAYSSGTILTQNQWNHVVAVRSGTGTNQFAIFVNGSRVLNTTDSYNWNVSGAIKVGGITTSGYYFNGYMTGLRIVKGSAVYDPTQSTLTIPTAPPTAISNTEFLLNYTNGGIIDNTMSNDLETVGNAQISTTQSKFGGASISLDGTGDWLLFPAGDRFAFGTGDYTVEAWLYFTSISSSVLQIIFMSGSTAGNTFYLHADGDQLSVGTSSAFISNQATTFSTNTWYHVAACRSGTTLRLFVNGTQIGSNATDSTNWISSGSARIGSNESGGQTFYGYIDDLRVTKGYARYTANFTAPVGPFVGFGD